VSALSARHFVLSLCAHTQQITEFVAKLRDFRMERHVLGSGRSVSGRRRVTPRRLRNVTLRRKAALFASEMTKNISNEFQKEIRLKIFRNKGFAPDRSARKASGSGAQGKSYAPSQNVKTRVCLKTGKHAFYTSI
ncbi:MAG TPA: hypothetical protein H9892_06815, partial [Candidatus Protoclostridium stercorigallinarum]|nr:hypothetical protein [Candidatus Protoclostridium stercorigallinarum]